jgi:hypothetical protein
MAPFHSRFGGLEYTAGQWRVYLVLPPVPDLTEWRAKLARFCEWWTPVRLRQACAVALLLAAVDMPRTGRVPGWQEALTPSDWGSFHMEQRGDVSIKSVSARMANAPLEIIPVPWARDGSETAPVDRIVRAYEGETGRQVFGAINGGFFDLRTGLPIGFLLRDGEMDFFNMPQGVRRSMVGFTRPGPQAQPAKVVISSPQDMPKIYLERVNGATVARTMGLHHINVAGGKNAFSLFTSRYGKWVEGRPNGEYFVAERKSVGGDYPVYQIQRRWTGAGRIEIPKNGAVIALQGNARAYTRSLYAGALVRTRWTLPMEWQDAGVAHGLLIGPRLLKDGKIAITAKEERLAGLKSRDRVILGTKADGEAVLMWLHHEKRKANLDFEQVAKLLADRGITNAIALDGGSSRAVVAVVKKPYSEERYVYSGRPVANALLLTLASANRT